MLQERRKEQVFYIKDRVRVTLGDTFEAHYSGGRYRTKNVHSIMSSLLSPLSE